MRTLYDKSEKMVSNIENLMPSSEYRKDTTDVLQEFFYILFIQKGTNKLVAIISNDDTPLSTKVADLSINLAVMNCNCCNELD